MNREETARAMAMLVNRWPMYKSTIPTDDEGLSFYTADMATEFADVSLEEFYAAVRTLSSEGLTFCPNWGEIRRRAVESRNPDIPDADQAWREVARHIQLIGRYGQPSWSHPVVEEAVRTIGWLNLLDGDADVVRGQFRKAYDACKKRFDAEMMMPDQVRAMLGAVGRTETAPELPPTRVESRSEGGFLPYHAQLAVIEGSRLRGVEHDKYLRLREGYPEEMREFVDRGYYNL